MALTLTAALGSYPHTEALLDGTVKPEGFDVNFVEVEPTIVASFRRMMRGLEFDFSELGITSYLSGWKSGYELTSLPVFPSTDFPFNAIQVNADAGVESPKDLEGRRIACRTYTVTNVVWARGMLADLYGVDHESITWVINDVEHAEGFVWPANVEYLPGADLAAMLVSGEVAAGFGIFRGESPKVHPLFPDPAAVEREWYSTAKIYPINHSIAMKKSTLAQDPSLAGKLLRYFDGGKQAFLARLESGVDLTDAEQALARRRALVGPDPIPYGIDATRPTLEALLRYSYDQHIIPEQLSVEEIFAPTSEA